jgi:hypothetical protein
MWIVNFRGGGGGGWFMYIELDPLFHIHITQYPSLPQLSKLPPSDDRTEPYKDNVADGRKSSKLIVCKSPGSNIRKSGR